MALTQAAYLLMLAEDARAKGDEFAERVRQEGIAHAQQVAELSTLIDRAKDIIDREKVRFERYAPRSEPESRPPVGVAPQPRIMRKVNEPQA